VKEMAARESELRSLIMQLPACNRQLLAWLMLHLENITTHVSFISKQKCEQCVRCITFNGTYADIFIENGHTCASVFVSEDVMQCEVVSSYLTCWRTWIFINMTASVLQFDNDNCIMLVCIIISHLNKKISSGHARYLTLDVET